MVADGTKQQRYNRHRLPGTTRCRWALAEYEVLNKLVGPTGRLSRAMAENHGRQSKGLWMRPESLAGNRTKTTDRQLIETKQMLVVSLSHFGASRGLGTTGKEHDRLASPTASRASLSPGPRTRRFACLHCYRVAGSEADISSRRP